MAGVNRSNFKELRQKYGIKLKEISEECGLSEQCISAFENSSGKYTETNAREYNAMNMCRTLMRMISKKDSTQGETVMDISKNLEVDEVVVRPIDKAHEKLMETAVPRDIFATVIRNYCMRNNISFGEFCKMCGISMSTISEAEIKKHPVVYGRTVQKVLKATGWTMDIFTDKKEDKDVDKKQFIMMPVDVKPEPEEVLAKPAPVRLDYSKKDLDRAEIKAKAGLTADYSEPTKSNVSYIFRDGKYYMLYDETRHVTREIDRGEFLKGVQ